ncbi:hypothetical protein ABZY36_38095 [Streptomyces sp. NPDC006627]|uniref:hypothetical protein n=1 Tax=Streptomyces sp. NPDC006627 TaxID=3154679 RepID=UPI0033BCEBAB
MESRDDSQPSESNSDVWIDEFGVHVAVPGSWRQPGVPESRTYDPLREVEHPGSEVYFPPVPNGLDYLVSVVEHLEADTERVSARDLKYAVLHLAADTEVLLKARLQLEHWSLVFADPAKAKRSELEDGSLTSCRPDDAVQRLKNIAKMRISDTDRDAVNRLAKDRNRLQHYGLFGKNANARSVESRAAEVLDFLIRFLDEDLLPALPKEEANAAQTDLERIRSGLVQIEGYVKQRMQRLRPELEPLLDRTVKCPDCRQWALVVEPTQGQGMPRNSRCRFCRMAHEGEDIAILYGAEVLMLALVEAVENCPHCQVESLVKGVRFAAAPDAPVAFCFQCTWVGPMPEPAAS